MSIHLETSEFDIEKIIKEVARVGATSVQILPEESRLILLRDVQHLYKDRSKIETTWVDEVGIKVKSISWEFRHVKVGLPSSFLELVDVFEPFVEEQLRKLPDYPFEKTLNLDYMELIRYGRYSKGLKPHYDGDFNLTFIFMLGGRGKFFACPDETGMRGYEIDTTPGNVILMRALGFHGNDSHQFHYTTAIESERYVLGLREQRV